MTNQVQLMKGLRARCGLSQSAMALQLGTSKSRISEYENLRKNISLTRFLEWCEKLNVDFKTL